MKKSKIGNEGISSYVCFCQNDKTLDLVNALIVNVEDAGFPTGKRLEESYATSFYAITNNSRFFVMIGAVADPESAELTTPYEFLISIDKTFSLMNYLRRKDNNDDDLISLVYSVSQFLKEHASITSVRWYTKENWLLPEGDIWTADPVSTNKNKVSSTVSESDTAKPESKSSE